MPRKSRIDTTGALQHIIARGIEGRRIFNDDKDRYGFIKRLGLILEETHTICYAWALIPNHLHLLLRTGSAPIATVIRRLLTGVSGNHQPVCDARQPNCRKERFAAKSFTIIEYQRASPNCRRICFKWEDGHAYEVEIVDYH